MLKALDKTVTQMKAKDIIDTSVFKHRILSFQGIAYSENAFFFFQILSGLKKGVS